MVDRTEVAVALVDPRTGSPGLATAAAGQPGGNTGLDAVLHATLSRMAALAEDGPERMRLRAEVVELALPLVSRLARRFRGRGEDLEDLTQAAAVALVKAVDSYDPGRGVPFAAYLVPCVIGALKRHFRDKGWDVRVPRPLQERHLAIEHATERLTQRLRRAPTADELAAELGLSTDEVVVGLAARQAYDTASLNDPVGADTGDDTLQDLLGGPDAALEETADRLSLRQLLQRLPTRERTIIMKRFFGNQTQLQIADDLGISQMHVSRILSQVLGWLRRALLDDGVAGYPGTEADRWLPVRVYAVGRSVLVAATGAVDARCAPYLRAVLVKAVITHRPQRLIVDLHGVPSMTTEGVAALVAAASASGHVGARMRVVRAAPPVVRVLDRAGLARMLAGVRLRPLETANRRPEQGHPHARRRCRENRGHGRDGNRELRESDRGVQPRPELHHHPDHS